MSKLVEARWVAGYEARLDKPGDPQDGTILVPGETIVKVPEGEAENDGRFEPVKRAKKGD